MEKLRITNDYENDEALLEKMKEAYRNCPTAIKYCRDNGIPEKVIDEEITKVYDFVSDLNYCKNCPGVKKCAKDNPMLCTRIVYTSGVLERQLVPCKEIIKRMNFERLFEVRDFPEEWLDINFKEDVDNNAGRKAALGRYRNYLVKGINNWIYLTGNKRSGRSYLAAAMVVDAAKRGKGPICFLDSSLRIRQLNDMSLKRKEDFQKLLDYYANVPILVFDDFGNEFKTDFIRDAIIFQILSNRQSKKLITIFTSDFSFDDIQELYSTSKAGAIRARQIAGILKEEAGKEINLGEIAIY
ncbi:MAG: ATP-binding protein [Bacilli bacterium]|nr:ATP-binding protein [Bacilli bacterium]